MIKFENVILPSEEQWRAIILGTRNAMNSWEKSDSCFGKCVNRERKSSCPSMMSCPIADDNNYHIGPNDLDLMKRLAAGGPVHAKYRRMITVYVDITAPLYWWKEFDTYRVGVEKNSCSTMHKIADKEFTLEDFSCEHLLDLDDNGAGFDYPCVVRNPKNQNELVNGECVAASLECLRLTIDVLNVMRHRYLKTKSKHYWWNMIQLLPSSYNQKRTVMLNYEVLAHIYQDRKGHRLDEWAIGFINFIKTLPYYEIIVMGDTNDD